MLEGLTIAALHETYCGVLYHFTFSSDYLIVIFHLIHCAPRHQVSVIHAPVTSDSVIPVYINARMVSALIEQNIQSELVVVHILFTTS